MGFRGQRIRCCQLEGDLLHPECMPINVPSGDAFMGRLRQDCLEYVRSCPVVRPQCSLGPREQINQASSFIDGSALYGSSKATARSLRTFAGGQLKAIRLNRKCALCVGKLSSNGALWALLLCLADAVLWTIAADNCCCCSFCSSSVTIDIHYLMTSFCFFHFLSFPFPVCAGRGKEMLAVQEEDNLDCKLAGDMRCFKSGDDR